MGRRLYLILFLSIRGLILFSIDAIFVLLVFIFRIIVNLFIALILANNTDTLLKFESESHLLYFAFVFLSHHPKVCRTFWVKICIQLVHLIQSNWHILVNEVFVVRVRELIFVLVQALK